MTVFFAPTADAQENDPYAPNVMVAKATPTIEDFRARMQPSNGTFVGPFKVTFTPHSGGENPRTVKVEYVTWLSGGILIIPIKNQCVYTRNWTLEPIRSK